MPRLRPLLPGIVAIAIVSGTLVLGSSMSVSACPFSGSDSFDSSGNRNDSGSLSRVDDRSRSSGNDGSESSLRQSSESRRGHDFGFVGDSRRLNATEAEAAGLWVVIGLFVLALFYKVRRAHGIAPAEVALLSKYPFLEHPEMVLTLVPQEALSSAFETEPFASRY